MCLTNSITSKFHVYSDVITIHHDQNTYLYKNNDKKIEAKSKLQLKSKLEFILKLIII